MMATPLNFWMKRLLTVVLTLWSLSGFAQTVLWSEDFEGESNNATTGTAGGTIGGTWSVLSFPPNGAGSFSRQNVLGGRFNVNVTGNGEGVWSSGVINISGYDEVAIGVDLVEVLSSNAQDYLRAYYRLNGGPEVLFGSIAGGGGLEVTSNASVILTGNSVEIVVRGRENSPNIFFIIPTFLAFDNIELVEIQTLYSRVSGNWNNTNVWSSTPGGVSCGCTPNNATHVNISHAVTMTGNGDAVNVTVESGGSLRFNGDYTLTVHRGGDVTVNSGGQINRMTNAGATIAFTWPGVTNNITANGTFAIGDLSVAAAATVNFSGSGNFSTADDFIIGGAANVSFSGTGSLSIGDDFLINDAATITNNKTGGTLAITGDLFFDTDNALVTNNHVLSAGNLVVNDNGDNANSLTNAAGSTLSIGAISLGNGDFLLDNYGTINQSGVFTNNSIDNGSSFINRGTAVWNWTAAGGSNDASVAAILNCSATGNIFHYGAGGDQTVFATQYHHLIMSNSGNKTAAAIDVNGDLTILGTAVFTAGGNAINLAGNWSAVNDASFTQSTAIITFDGNGDQTISNGTGGGTFGRMVVNKPSGNIILVNNLTLSGGGGTDLTLTNGIIYSSSSALLIINDEVTTSGGNSASFVDGPIRKIGNDAFVFPTGKNGRFARIEITNLTGATTSSEFTAEYFDSPHANLTVDGSLSHVSHGEYWTLTRAVNTPGARVRLYWQDSFSDITNFADLTVARYTGTNWTNAGGTNAGVPAGPGTSWSAAVSDFQAFTFGSLGGINPLPVELLYFKATLKNNEVELTWETASELNNDYFTIERAVDVENFVSLGTVAGNGTSSVSHKYRFTDANPLYGRAYYRLKQTDFDGTVSYSDISAIEYSGPEYPVLTLYPNPVIAKKVTLRFDGYKTATEVPITVSDLSGRVILRTIVNIPEGAAWETEIDLEVAPGAYLITAGTEFRLSKIVIVK